MDVKRLLLLMLVGVLCLTLTESIPISKFGPHMNSLSEHKGQGCAHKCPEFLKPVCAVDDAGFTKDFKNVCFVYNSYCKERKVYAYVKEGFC